MSAKPPARTAAALIRNILSTNPPLSSSQIYKIGTAGVRPVLRPSVAFRTDGAIRMKRASNLREGSRMWIPPAQAPFPHHPFQSMSHLKKNILANLEMQDLIQKVLVSRPLETDEERQEAIKTAAKLTRRMEARALRAGVPAGPPVEPTTEIKEYRWVLVTAPSSSDPPIASSSSSAGLAAADISLEQMYRWTKAEKLESTSTSLREMELQDIERRREERLAHWKSVREQLKVQKAEDKASGRWDQNQHRIKVQEARDEILRYAEQTGEDVSSWLEELDGAEVEMSEKDIRDMARYEKRGPIAKQRRRMAADQWGTTRLVGRVSPERKRRNEEINARLGAMKLGSPPRVSQSASARK